MTAIRGSAPIASWRGAHLATFWLDSAAIRVHGDKHAANRDGMVQVTMLPSPFPREAKRAQLDQLIRAYTD